MKGHEDLGVRSLGGSIAGLLLNLVIVAVAVISGCDRDTDYDARKLRTPRESNLAFIEECASLCDAAGMEAEVRIDRHHGLRTCVCR